MKLKKVVIHNFKSIGFEQHIDINNITSLVGANEGGKTNVLLSISSFDPNYTYDENDLCDFVDSEMGEPIKMVTLNINLDSDDVNAFAELPINLSTEELNVTKFFDGSYELNGIKLETPEIDEQKLSELLASGNNAVNQLIEHINTHYDPLPESHPKRDNAVQSLNKFKSTLNNARNYTTYAETGLEVQFEETHNYLKELPQPNNQIEGLISKFYTGIIYILVNLKDILIPQGFVEEFFGKLPKIFYFDEWDTLEDSASLESLEAEPQNHRTLLNLLSLAGLTINDLKIADRESRSRKLTRSGAIITGYINNVWTQEKVSVKFELNEGNILDVFIEGSAGDYGKPSRKSRGFLWYLSFFINFTAETQSGRFRLVLLDEPGIHLHASGQVDLLKVFEKIAKDDQVIYTAHSPFLINKNYPLRLRAITKIEAGLGDDEFGTIVDNKPYRSSKQGPWEPVRTALGMSLGYSLYFSGRNLIVEGIVDYVLLAAVSRFMARKGKTFIDLQEISIVMSAGVHNVPRMAYLSKSENVKSVVLLDNDTQGDAVREKLLVDQILLHEDILQINDFCKENRKRDIEDMFSEKFYINAVNHVMQEKVGDDLKVMEEDIKLDSTSEKDIDPRITERLKNFFREKDLGKFEQHKLAVAQCISEQLANGVSINNTTEDRFLRLFEKVNIRFGLVTSEE